MRKIPLLIFTILIGASILCEAKPKKTQSNNPDKTAGFQQLFASLFNEWDSNHDGVLDMKELNAAVENPQVQGNDAAVAVFLHRHLQVDKEGQANGLSLTDVQALAANPEVQKNISGKTGHIEGINHSLFAAGDPNLETFHQGGIGDCYLLAVIGTYVYQHPLAVRTMIQEVPSSGGFQIAFGTGRMVNVAPLTDGELILGASEGRNHGIWLSVLEKAYAEIDLENKERKTGKLIDADEAVDTDFIGHGGYYSPVIVLLSGHKAEGAALGRWVKQDPQGGLERAHELLAKLSVEHKLMATGSNGDKTKKLPKGIVHGHVYGVLGYNPVTRMVTVFNPWGNSVRPKGPPGLVNGYPTEHGIFQVPLNEFVQIFGGFTYETDKPATAQKVAGS